MFVFAYVVGSNFKLIKNSIQLNSGILFFILFFSHSFSKIKLEIK